MHLLGIQHHFNGDAAAGGFDKRFGDLRAFNLIDGNANPFLRLTSSVNHRLLHAAVRRKPNLDLAFISLSRSRGCSENADECGAYRYEDFRGRKH